MIPRASDVPRDVMRVIRRDVRATMERMEKAISHDIPPGELAKYETFQHLQDLVQAFLAMRDVAAVRGRTTEMTDDEALACAFAYKRWAEAAQLDERGPAMITGMNIEAIRCRYEAELAEIRERQDAVGRTVRFMEEHDAEDER